MSVETANAMEHTPVAEPQTALPVTEPAVASHNTSETPVHAPTEHSVQHAVESTQPAVATESATQPIEPPKEDEAVVSATPALEGVLGYKEPGFLSQFRYTKQHFWFNDEPLTHESVTTFLRNDKTLFAFEHFAWARETGKGLLFHAKRHEDKAAPAGLISLYDATSVATEGSNDFSFKSGAHVHRFQAASTQERDSWVVAIKKSVEESAAMKDQIVGRESYKKNLTEYESRPGAGAAAIIAKSTRSKSKEPKKEIDAAAANNASTTPVVPATAAAAGAADNTSGTSSDKEEKKAKKERSQSRKRQSIFGNLLGKKEERDDSKEVKKEQKEEQKAVKKAEKEEVKQEKKAEAEQKKEEAKAEHDPSKGVEAAEAAGLAAVPAAAIAAEKKHEDKADDKTTEPATTDKKAKRGSVFGSLFQKKGVTSPSTEKSEKDVMPLAATKEGEIAPVSETAPQVPEPVGAAPIDAAAVTAPTETGPTTLADEPTRETTTAPFPATESTTTPKTEKKGFMSFIKKNEPVKKDTPKDETNKALPAEPTAATTTDVPATTQPTGAVTSPVTSPSADPTEKNVRRSSFFGFGGKKKSENPETEEPTGTSAKRDKSPLPGALGGLSRKFSKAKTTDKPKETTDATPAVASVPESTETSAAPTTTPATAVEEPTTTTATSDATPALPDTPAHEATTLAPEVKTTA